jgi:hypothetical protein
MRAFLIALALLAGFGVVSDPASAEPCQGTDPCPPPPPGCTDVNCN